MHEVECGRDTGVGDCGARVIDDDIGQDVQKHCPVVVSLCGRIEEGGGGAVKGCVGVKKCSDNVCLVLNASEWELHYSGKASAFRGWDVRHSMHWSSQGGSRHRSFCSNNEIGLIHHTSSTLFLWPTETIFHSVGKRWL